MMKQKRIVAVALGLALSVSPMIVLPTAFADQVSGNPSSSISARSTAPNPLDKFSAEEKAYLEANYFTFPSTTDTSKGFDGWNPSVTEYTGLKTTDVDGLHNSNSKYEVVKDGDALFHYTGASGKDESGAKVAIWSNGATAHAGEKYDTRTVTYTGRKSGASITYVFTTLSKVNVPGVNDSGTTGGATNTKGLNADEKAFIDKYKDTIASALGIDGFAPSTTDYYGVKESVLDTVADKIPTANKGLKLLGAPIEIDTNATGWLADGKTTQTKPAGTDLAYRVTIRGKSGGTVAYTLHTRTLTIMDKADAAELKNVTATANGKQIQGFDPTKTGTWTVPDGAEVKLSGLPDGWGSYKNLDAKPGTLSYDIKKGDVTVVTWTFTYDSTTDPDKPSTGADVLKGVAATVDGKPLPSFDPTKSGTYRVATGAEVKISNVPSDWKLDKTASDSKLVFTASKDGTTVTWTFEYQGKDDDGATTNPGDNAGNNSQNNNVDTTSKPPVNGANPLASTGVGIGWVGWLIGILAIIGGALGITVAVRKPKGKATDETPAPEADDSEASSDQPLNS